MNVMSVAAAALIAVTIVICLKKYNPEYAVVASIVSVCVIITMVLSEISGTAQQIKTLFEESNIQGNIIKDIFKAVGICFITQFAADICSDFGQKALGNKVEFCGKIAIVIITLPYVENIIGTVVKLVG